MIRTFIHIALKYLIRQPAYSVLSIIGFSLALASVFFIYSHVSYQNGYDKHVDTWDRVYRLSGEINLPANENIHALLGPKLSPVMKEELPAVENMTRLVPFHGKCIISREEDTFFEEQVYYADSTFFEVFPIPIIVGSPEAALKIGQQVVISESIALKYFGRTNALGEDLKINNADFEVSAIMSDLPANAHHKMHILISMNTFGPEAKLRFESDDSENYWRPSCYHFILLTKQNSISEVESAFPDFFDRHMAEFGSFLKADFNLLIHALPDLHFTPQYSYDLPKGNRSYNYLMIGAGIFLLLIALLNYTNLLSASMASRTRSLGIFKINGAYRSHLYRLLMTESAIILLISALVAWFILSGVQNYMERWFEGALLSSGIRTGSFLVLLLAIFIAFLLAFLLSVLSRVYRQPITLLRGDSKGGMIKKPYGFGKGSIILQFTFSVILIISSIVITRQVRYMLYSETGYNKDNVVQVKLHAEGLPLDKITSFKQEVQKSSMVSMAAYSSNIPGEALGTAHFKLNNDGGEASKIVSLMAIDADYIPLMQMEFRDGRNFDQSRPMDPQSGLILNESCIDFLGLGEDLVGTKIQHIEILGILKRGLYNSLHEASRPIVFNFETGPRGYMNVKLNTSDIQGALAYLEETYDTFFEGIPFDASFLDNTVEEMYRNDINQSKLLGIFTALSIAIANIGLFGLVALMNRKRIKEIGIRKVNGAQRWQIALLLGKQLFIWVLIAVVIAIPLTWYISSLWLQNFATRTSMVWWIIPLGGLIILVSALLTTFYMTMASASRNPVDTLRYE